MKRPSHLILPDAHSNADYSNERFRALGNFIVERRPATIIAIGDFADMGSLSNFDRGKLSYEKRRYQRDIDAAIDAQEEMFAPIRAYNKRATRKSEYHPRLILTLGNHEARIDREVQDNPGLYGKLSISDLKYEEYGWKVYPFLAPALVDSITYSHYFVSGVAGRPISGESIGKTLCLKLHASAVAGHSHVFDHSERAIINGTKIFGMSCGCFVHPDYSEPWCAATIKMWWKGVVELVDLDLKGYYDQIRATTLRKLMREYL